MDKRGGGEKPGGVEGGEVIIRVYCVRIFLKPIFNKKTK